MKENGLSKTWYSPCNNLWFFTLNTNQSSFNKVLPFFLVYLSRIPLLFDDDDSQPPCLEPSLPTIPKVKPSHLDVKRKPNDIRYQ